MKQYDVIIPFTESNIDLLRVSIDYIRYNLQPKNIVLIGKGDILGRVTSQNVIKYDEDSIIDRLSYHKVYQLIKERKAGCEFRTGWYFQQFLKMGYSLKCEDEYYLVWDADTVPLNRIDFLNSNNVPLFTMKKEYNRPYFVTLKKFFPQIEVIRHFDEDSYIAEQMLFSTRRMRELIQRIEENRNITGDYFYEKIINAIDVMYLSRSGFSEFETYGFFMDTYYKGEYEKRTLRTLREAKRYCKDGIPTLQYLRWASRSYDMVSFENQLKPYKHCYLWDNSFIHSFMMLQSVIDKRNKIMNYYDINID